MSRYFPPHSGSRVGDRKSVSEDPETIKYTVEPPRPRAAPSGSTAGQDTGGGTRLRISPGSGPAARSRPRSGPVAGQTGRRSRRTMNLNEIRNIPSGDNDARKRTIFFAPDEGGLATIAVEAVGVAGNEQLALMAASEAEIRNGLISRRLVPGERVRIDLQFAEEYRRPIELQATIVPDARGNDENH